MSYNKENRSKKRYMDKVHMARQEKIYKYYNTSNPVVAGKFRKKKAMNCGNAGCHFCSNARHLFGYITFNEEKENVTFNEYLKEIKNLL